jgi:hypothetical protein
LSANTSLGAHLSAKKKARELEPIEYETVVIGYCVETIATGTVEQLVAAGIITAEHLPPGRCRQRYERLATGPVHLWSTFKLADKKVRAIASHRTEKGDGIADRVLEAQRALVFIESSDAATTHRRSLNALARVGAFTTEEMRHGGRANGITLDAASTAKLDAICDQVKVLYRQAQEVIDAAVVVTIKPEREAYLRDLRARANLPMLALPAVETEACHG